MSMLYTKCEFCNGTRISRQDIIKSCGGVIPAGSVCPLCKDGYEPVGMTEKQLERQTNERDSLLLFAAFILAHDFPDAHEWIGIRASAKALIPNTAVVDDIMRRRGIHAAPQEPPQAR